MIIEVKKEEIYPAFGKCNSLGAIRIREDLGVMVKSHVLAHELVHRSNPWKSKLLNELRAGFLGMLLCPIGFVVTVAKHIISIDRWKFYWKVYIKGE